PGNKLIYRAAAITMAMRKPVVRIDNLFFQMKYPVRAGKMMNPAFRVKKNSSFREKTPGSWVRKSDKTAEITTIRRPFPGVISSPVKLSRSYQYRAGN